MSTALDVVYALETADLFGGTYDHTAHRHPFRGLPGCGCPPEVVDAWALHCDGVRVHYADGVHTTRADVNRALRSSADPQRRLHLARVRHLAIVIGAGALAVVGVAGSPGLAVLMAAVFVASYIAASTLLSHARDNERARDQHTVYSDQMPTRFEMLTTMAAMTLVLDKRVATISSQIGRDAAAEFDATVTAALHDAARTAADIRDLCAKQKATGSYQPLPHHELWRKHQSGLTLNPRVVRTESGDYSSPELTELAGLYRTWVAQIEAVSALIGWSQVGGQLSADTRA